MDILGDLTISARAEVERGTNMYPNPDGLLAALMEEVGELARALMSQTKNRVREEAIQVAALALRIALEGDPTLNKIRERNGADRELPSIPLYKS